MRCVLLLSLLLPALAALAADTVSINLVDPPVITKRLEAGIQPHNQRAEAIRRLFADAGCETTTQRVRKNADNVICTLPGQTDATIVVGGHYDYVEHDSKGIIDDWTGTSLLPSLYQALKPTPRKHTYVFVAFAAEEEGLFGSKRFVKELDKEQREKTRAFVNLECLGLGPVNVWATRSTPELVRYFAQVTSSLKTQLGAVNVENIGDDDTHPFKDAKMPVISLHSITQNTLRIIHSPKDNLDAVSNEDLYTSYKMVALYLALLDLKLAQ